MGAGWVLDGVGVGFVSGSGTSAGASNFYPTGLFFLNFDAVAPIGTSSPMHGTWTGIHISISVTFQISNVFLG